MLRLIAHAGPPRCRTNYLTEGNPFEWPSSKGIKSLPALPCEFFHVPRHLYQISTHEDIIDGKMVILHKTILL